MGSAPVSSCVNATTPYQIHLISYYMHSGLAGIAIGRPYGVAWQSSAIAVKGASRSASFKFALAC